MKKLSSRKSLTHRGFPAIVAVGSSLAALPAAALELGELTVQSRLGQPLRASIAYALAPNEQLSDYCVTMRPGPSVSGLPGFGAATVSVAKGVIMLTGKTPVREPMVSAHVVVNCPYTANLSREYLLFIDPLSSAQATTTPQAEPIATTRTVVEHPVTAMKAKPVQKDVATATIYQVKPGESLSEIAQRIENRPVGLWPAVNAIFAANPDAFVNNDPNRLKARSRLSIPAFDGSATVVAAPGSVVEPTAAYTDSATYEPAAVVDTAPIEEAYSAADMTRDLQPGDVILDTKLKSPTTASSSPNVPTAMIVTDGVATDNLAIKNPGTDRAASPSWLIWLAGSGIALIFGLLMFGRRLFGHFGTTPAASLVEQPHRRRFSDMQATDTESVEAPDVDYDLTDDSPTEENLALDADLIIGTGLEPGATSGDLQDFGFAATTDLDIELPFEPVAQVSDETDMLPPLRTDEHSILESEVLPEDDDYDMSVIVDATKMPQPDDVTEHDLKAVEIATVDDTLIAQNYTINKEADYQVLEQDYEDEMTATQALNEEIARAAAELTQRKEDDETTALPLATVTELDITAQMPAQNDDETAEMPAESGKAS